MVIPNGRVSNNGVTFQLTKNKRFLKRQDVRFSLKDLDCLRMKPKKFGFEPCSTKSLIDLALLI